MGKKILIAIGVIIVLFLLVLGIGYYLLTRPPSVPKLPAEVPAEITKESPEAATRLDAKVKAFQKEIKEAQAKGEKKTVTLVVTEGELNSMLSQQLTGQELADLPTNLELEEAKVYLREGLLRFAIRAKISGISINATIAAEIAVIDGKPKVKVKSIDMGKLPLPGAVTDRLAKFFTDQLEGLKILDLPVPVTSVVIEGGQLIITAMT